MPTRATAPRSGTARERRATLADVARAAGVSASTASLAMNRSGPVSEATRERVLAAARTLGYGGPDPLARSLRRGRCGVVAVVVGERLGYAFRDPMMVMLLDGLAEEIGATGSSLLLVPVHSSGADAAERLTSLPMDAAVLVDCETPTTRLLAALRTRGTAVVGVDGPHGTGVPLVDIDDEGGTRALVEHLAGHGHRHFGVISLPLSADRADAPRLIRSLPPVLPAEAPGVPRRRTDAATAAVAAVAGATLQVVEAAGNLVEEGERAAGLLLDGVPGSPRPTALVAQSDVLALGCLHAAAARGLTVPGDVSVAGFDGVDLQLLDGTLLTTIVQPSTDKGRAAARLVTATLDGEHPADVRLPTWLRVGTTTGPVPPSPRQE